VRTDEFVPRRLGRDIRVEETDQSAWSPGELEKEQVLPKTIENFRLRRKRRRTP